MTVEHGRFRFSKSLKSGLVGLASIMLAVSVAAQPPSGAPSDRTGPFFSLSGSLVEQFDADLDTQGSYSASSLLLSASVAQPVSRKTILGLSLSYDLLDYEFSDDVLLEEASPWDRVHGLNLALPVIRRINEKWTMLLSPSLGSYGASGAAFGDTVTWGAVFAATYAFRDDRKLGFGVGVFDRIGQTRGFPFISIDWRLSERLRLTNPLTAGPTGPAGLELAYEVSPNWEIGAGGAYRTIRFRLDERDLEPNGIGEQRGIVTFARLLHTFSPKLNLVIYTGLVLDGELRIEDEDAQRRRTVGHGTAPLLAISLSGRF
jgi:hypothetical protein